MADKFTEGTVVQLKSGGPLMTVNTRTQYGDYFCEWFDGMTPKSAKFKEAMLQEYVETPMSDIGIF